MKYLIFFLSMLSALICRADVVLYDEPQLTGYQWASEKKSPSNSTVIIETCSYNNACSGVASIEGTNITIGSKFSISFGNGWIYPNEFTAFVFHINVKGLNGGRINVHVYSGVNSDIEVGTKAMVQGNTYGFVGGQYGVWQTVTIPISAFSFPDGTYVNRFTFDPVLASPGFFIDAITLIGNGVIHYPNPYPP